MAKASPYTPYKEEWISLYQAGSSIREIAQQHGVSKATVKRLIQHDVDLRPKSPTLQYAKTWVSLYEEGWSVNEIGQRYGFSATAVSRRLKSAGVVLRHGYEKASAHDKHIPAMAQLYEEGNSLRDIGRVFGIAAQTVHNLLKKADVPLRSYAESSRQYPFNEHYFDTVDTKEKAYWLGFVFATASLNERVNSHQVSLSFLEPYIEHVEWFSTVIESEKPIRKRSNEERFELVLCSEHLFTALEKWGLKRDKSNTQFPDLPKTLLKSFLLGFFDGAGSLIVSDAHTSFSLTAISNPTFLLSAGAFIKQETGVTLKQMENRNTVISYSKYNIVALLHWLYWEENVFLPFKRLTFNTLQHSLPKR